MPTRSDDIGQLVEALAKAQGTIEAAKRESVNPAFKFRYASLDALRDVIRTPLSANGLVLMQPPTTNGGQVSVTTILAHVSGQWISESISVSLEKATAQAIGSAITYLRRYSMSGLLNLSAEDDDGEAAKDAGNAPETEAVVPRKAPAPKPKSSLVQAAVEMGATVEPRSEDDMALWANEDRTPDQREELIALLAKNDLTNQWLADEGYWTVPAKPISRAGAYRAIVRLQQMPAV